MLLLAAHVFHFYDILFAALVQNHCSQTWQVLAKVPLNVNAMLKAIEKEGALIQTHLYDTIVAVHVQANCANFQSPLQ